MPQRYGLIVILLLFFYVPGFSQSGDLEEHYLEDQLYASINYNFFRSRPQDYQRTGLPVGFQLGFIKDVPLTKSGRYAFAIGGGYSISNYKHNIELPAYVLEDYALVNASGTLVTHAVELPIEFRFRTSSPEIKPFFRAYGGFLFQYIFYARNIYRQDGVPTERETVTPLLDRSQHGFYISVGYGNINGYLFFGTKPLFVRSPEYTRSAVTEMKSVKIGLRFYIF